MCDASSSTTFRHILYVYKKKKYIYRGPQLVTLPRAPHFISLAVGYIVSSLACMPYAAMPCVYALCCYATTTTITITITIIIIMIIIISGCIVRDDVRLQFALGVAKNRKV